MFDYLIPAELSGITGLSLENFVSLYFEKKDADLIDKIKSAQEKIVVRNLAENLWRDLTIHFFYLPQPYYLGSEEAFLYFYNYRQDIAAFLKSAVLDGAKTEEIHRCAIDPDRQILAVCYSLSLIDRYRAPGHLICVNTYQTLLGNSPKEMRGLYATQAYFHSLLLQRQFRESKQIWADLGWKTMFKENYGKPQKFVNTVLSRVKPYLTRQEQSFARQLAEKTHQSFGNYIA